MKKILVGLFVVFYTYAFVRYHIGSKIPLTECLFVLNKALAWFSFTLIGLSVLPKKWFRFKSLKRKTLGMTGFIVADLHILFNLCLLSSKRYPLFFLNEASLSSLGIGIISLASISFICFLLAFSASINYLPKYFLKFAYPGFVCLLFHPALIGCQKWLHPMEWPLYLPPITLLAFLTGITFLFYRKYLKKFRPDRD